MTWPPRCWTASSKANGYDPLGTDLNPEVAARLASQERELERLRAEVAAWRASVAEHPVRHDVEFTSVSGRAVEAGVHAARPVAQPGGARPAGRVPVHPRHPPDHVPRPALDHAPVRRVRHRGGHQRALQVPAGARPDGALGRVRFPDADGVRLRPPPLGGRGRQVRRRDLESGRHGDAVRGDSARPGLHLDDDQRAGRDAVLFLRGRGRAAGRTHRRAAGHDPERHSQGVHGAARLDLSPRSRRSR